MTPIAKPAAGMHLFYLDGAGVLFSEATQELHLLNPTATVIWSLLEEGHDADTASVALGQMSGLDAASGNQLVDTALAQWHDKRFLEGAPPAPPEHLPNLPSANAPTGGPTWRQPEIVDERHYRILGTGFRVCFTNSAQARKVRPVIEHLAAAEPMPEETAVDIVETADRLVVYRDRESFAECGRVDELAPIVKSLIWVTAVNRHDFFLDIHAGVVGDGTKCVLLPASAGSGKSTLTASLVHAGYQFFSDEVALLEEGSFDVFPVPLAMCVKAEGIAALAQRYPELSGLDLHLRADGKRVAYMPPPPESLPASNDAYQVAALVFPRYESGAATSLAPLPKCDALERLLRECLVVRKPLDFARIEGLVKWIARTPCYSLHYGLTEDAVARIESVFAKCAELAPDTCRTDRATSGRPHKESGSTPH